MILIPSPSASFQRPKFCPPRLFQDCCCGGFHLCGGNSRGRRGLCRAHGFQCAGHKTQSSVGSFDLAVLRAYLPGQAVHPKAAKDVFLRPESPLGQNSSECPAALLSLQEERRGMPWLCRNRGSGDDELPLSAPLLPGLRSLFVGHKTPVRATWELP